MNSPPNQRIRRRLGVSAQVHVHYRGGPGPEASPVVRALDISEDGVRLIVPQMLPVGREVTLIFAAAAGPRLERRAVIIWCAAPMGEGFAAGFRFQETLSRLELDGLALR